MKLFLILLIFIACSEKRAATTSTCGMGLICSIDPLTGEREKFGPAETFDSVRSEAEIVTLTYNSTEHSVRMELSYSGCKEARLTLQLVGCAESYPRQCRANLLRARAYDSTCKMDIRHAFTYPLDASFDTVRLTVGNRNDQGAIVTVDRNGVLAQAQP